MTATGLICPTCTAATAPGDVFCEACGADLPVTEAVATEVNDTGAQVAAPSEGGSEAAGGSDALGDVAGEPSAIDGGPAAFTGLPCPSCGADPASVAGGYCGECGLKQPARRDHIETTGEGVAAVTDRGRRHHRNEDAFAFSVTAGGSVRAVVCDGVSTSVKPDEASQQAVDQALAVLEAANGSAPDDAHRKAFDSARAAVLAVEWAPEPDLGPPSCTYLAATVDGGVAELANLGDCRAYWLADDGTASMLTDDDSWASETVKAGEMTEAEAYADPRAHSITKWLAEDGDPTWQPRRTRFEAEGPGRLILCSDGLWNYALRPEQVAEAAGTGDLLTVARRLVDHANAAGGSDNITVVLVAVPRPVPSTTDPPKGPDA